MRSGLAVVGMLTACGRLAFDAGDAARDGARVCAAPAGHDEDNDGTDDACDVCPHLADDQRDGDNDGVGDACDPEPANPRQQIVLFDPLLDNRNAWQLEGATIDASGAHMSALGGFEAIHRPVTEGTYLFSFGANVTAIGSGQHHIALLVEDTGAVRYFYCELLSDDAVTQSLAFTYTLDQINYLHDSQAARTVGLLGTSGTLEMAMQPIDARCATDWGGEPSETAGTRHGIAAAQVSAGAFNADMTVHWFFEIRTN